MRAPDIVAPTWRTAADYVETDGDLAARYAELANFPPDPEQRLVLDDLFAVQPDGRLAHFEVGIVCPRQNLKTGVLKQAAVAWLLDPSVRLIVWSAHSFPTAAEAFRDLEELVTSHPSLGSQVKRITRGNGDEAIEMQSKQRLVVKARTSSGGRGLTGDRVVLDEAFALTPKHMGSLLPTLSARPDPQVIYASSAGLVDSAVLRAIRDRGRAGSPRLAYLEWGDPRAGEGCELPDCDHAVGSRGCALDDRERWQAANPQAGRRISWEYLEAERRALPADEFARERLGWWDEPAAGAGAIDLVAWQRLTNTKAAPGDPVVFGIDVAPNHAWSSIVAVGFGSNGKPVGEVVERRGGSHWVGVRLRELQSAHEVGGVVFDETGPVAALRPYLEQEGVSFEALSGREVAQATDSLLADIDLGRLEHRGDEALTAAIVGARLRRSGDLVRLSRVDSTVDISPLVALTVALHLHRNGGSSISPSVYFV